MEKRWLALRAKIGLSVLAFRVAVRCRLAYLTTDWKRGEGRRLANWRSEEEEATVRVPQLESLAVCSSADFPRGAPALFLMTDTPFNSVAAVAAGVGAGPAAA